MVDLRSIEHSIVTCKAVMMQVILIDRLEVENASGFLERIADSDAKQHNLLLY